MPTDQVALEFLSSLERAELQLLSWGLTDGFFAEQELLTRADAFLDDLRSKGRDVSSYSDAAQLVGALLDANLLWPTPTTERYRTRMAEAVRLFARIRQIFPDAKFQAWRTAPSLVADYRLLVVEREYPRRDVKPTEALAAIRKGRQSGDVEERVLKALFGFGTATERSLAGFQVRATRRILGTPVGDRARATIVCAGTGSGKTLAFYMPAFAAVAARISDAHWTKCLALYPRNELLKDQLREALANAKRVNLVLATAKRRGLSLGALYGDVPEAAKDVLEGGTEWPRVTVEGRPGRECPFVRCPSCTRTMIWMEEDVRSGTERLRCSQGCAETVAGEVVRLTRKSLLARPPDVLFTSTEMLNQRLSSARYSTLVGVGLPPDRRPLFVLLDEAHAYEGAHGAHVALLLRRWRKVSEARPHFVGLSATLADAGRFFSELVGVGPGDVAEEGPRRAADPAVNEMESEGAEYQLALRGDPASGTSLLSTTIQATMLMRRVLAAQRGSENFGSKVFAFTDNLDVLNRLFHNLLDAEGWTSFGRPNPRRPTGSLANLRATALPSAADRWAAGQHWKLVEDIGHVLAPNARTKIGRTSSQDRGVDSAAEVIVATSSLEVGFDDPEVGAVLQHKAPQSAAAFLQRKGRSGRRRDMRPWTVVVLSDYGRDRLAYQSYEQIFAPALPPRYLPLGNRAVLRMQAAYALMEWLARRTAGAARPEPWGDLAQPASVLKNEKAREVVSNRQATYVPVLKSLLEDAGTREDLAQFVRRALALDEDAVSALLWEPPRGLLTEVVPTLLRRLETGWRRANSAQLEDNHRWAPMPEFVPRTLFSDLQLPEAAIRVPALGAIQARSEWMPLVQALREFAPGRVSRRFGTTHGGESHWIDPGSDNVLDISTFCPAESRQLLGAFTVRMNGAVEQRTVFRPIALSVATPPKNVLSSSNAFLEWRTQIVPGADSISFEPPTGSVWSTVIKSIRFYTHTQGAPVEVRRCAVGVRASVAIRKQGSTENEVGFVVAGPGGAPSPCGVGFVADVDGVQVTFRYPDDLGTRVRADAQLMCALRPRRFRDKVRADPALDGVANSFQRDWLAQAYVSAVATEALRSGVSIADAEERVYSRTASTAVEEIVRTILQWADSTSQSADGDEDDSDDAQNVSAAQPQSPQAPRRVTELLGMVAPGPAWEALHRAASTLSGDDDLGWELWIRERFRSTLATAFAEAAQRLCPQMDGDALYADVEARPDEPQQDKSTDEFWLTEATIGGGGFIEQFFDRFSEDPRRFFRMVDAALEASDLEQVALDLGIIVDRVGFDGGSGATLRECFAGVRGAGSYAETLAALSNLRDGLSRSDIQPSVPLLTALNSRVLRPGTTPNIDRFTAEKQRRWNEAEIRLGVEIDLRVFALVESADASLEAALMVSDPPGPPQAVAAWRYGVLYGMFWPRGSQVRSEALKNNNPFDSLPETDRVIVLTALRPSVTQVSLGEPAWFELLSDALVKDGVAQLNGGDGAVMADALLRLGVEPVDSTGILVNARVAAISRDQGGWRATVELPEAFQ